MAEYDIFDGKRHWVSEDNVPWNTKYSANMDTYTDPLATYHSSMSSIWLGESEDFAMLLSGQWSGTADVAAISGSIASSIGFPVTDLHGHIPVDCPIKKMPVLHG